jgi:hypothetical protein
MGFGASSHMLFGLAIETLVKGILVQRDLAKWVPNPGAANIGRYSWKAGNGHDLGRPEPMPSSSSI